jgi:hypothetical protein
MSLSAFVFLLTLSFYSQVFRLRLQSVVHQADNTIILGDGVDDNRWVDTFDLDAALAAAHGTIVIATANPTAFATTDTIDVKFTGATTAPTSGVLRVYALMVDVTDLNAPGIAAVGS